MKPLKLLVLIAIAFVFFSACKKDHNDVPVSQADVVGLFKGKYGTGNNEPSSFYSFNLKQDGTLEELNSTGAVIGIGTWTLNGKTVHTYHHYLSPSTAYFSSSAIYDLPERTMIGTWGYGNSDADGGKWYMTKQ